MGFAFICKEFFILHTPPLVLRLYHSFLRLFAFPPMDAGDTMQRILGLLVGSPNNEKRQLLKNAMEVIQSESNVASTPSLSVAEDYLRISRHLLRPALFPHCGRPLPPWNNGAPPRELAWEWIFSQINGPASSDSWIHRSYLPRIQPCLRHVISECAWCDYPLYLPPRLIAQFASAFTTISTLCVQLQNWGLVPPTPRADLVVEY